MKHKKLFISLTAVLSVLLFFLIFISVWYLGDYYPDFKGASPEFDIPGLDEGAVPQGMGSCFANYTVENVKQKVETDDAGNETVIDVVETETKMQAYFFISAYMKDGSPSRIYVVGQNTGYVGYVTLKTVDGSNFYGHAGGIAINNYTNEAGTSISNTDIPRYYTLWVTCDSTVFVAKCSDEYAKAKKSIAQEIVEKAAGIKLPSANADEEYDFSVRFTTSFNANCRASFCYYFDDPSVGGYTTNVSSDRFYVGEFYNDGKYHTDDSHKLTTPNGYKNTAFMYEYKVAYDKDNPYGLALIDKKDSDTDPVRDEDRVPKITYIYSIPEKIQGVAWSGRDRAGSNNGIMILSQSYGLSNSHLLCFNYGKIMTNANRKAFSEVNGSTFVYEGVKRTSGIDYKEDPYVYFADKANEEMFINDLSIPAMSEGMCNVTPVRSTDEGMTKFYILFESGSKKYKTFVRRQMKQVYSIRFQRLDPK